MKSTRHWDIFCKVIDNYGDIGVCWRLAADLASRGVAVRLWVDDPAALDWMAPGALAGQWPGVRVLRWEQCCDAALMATLPAADVWIEGFGCELAPEFVAQRFSGAAPGRRTAQDKPVWINLEYLSAETFARQAHGLPSPVMHGPAKGATKHFYFPGLTPDSGGLIRERDLAARQAAFDRAPWLAQQGIAWQGERLVSLFCYEPGALADLLAQARDNWPATRLLVTHGRAAAAVRAWLARPDNDPERSHSAMRIEFLRALTQTDYDHLLWSCDLNFVRGEDSVVRAIWAGRPFIWQIYPQHDDAHHHKLDAFLDALDAPASWRQAHQAWNDPGGARLPPADLPLWRDAVLRARSRLVEQSDLATRLLSFVARVRDETPISAENH